MENFIAKRREFRPNLMMYTITEGEKIMGHVTVDDGPPDGELINRPCIIKLQYPGVVVFDVGFVKRATAQCANTIFKEAWVRNHPEG